MTSNCYETGSTSLLIKDKKMEDRQVFFFLFHVIDYNFSVFAVSSSNSARRLVHQVMAPGCSQIG